MFTSLYARYMRAQLIILMYYACLYDPSAVLNYLLLFYIGPG